MQAVAIRQLLVLCLVVYEKIYLKYDSYTTVFIIVDTKIKRFTKGLKRLLLHNMSQYVKICAVLCTLKDYHNGRRLSLF